MTGAKTLPERDHLADLLLHAGPLAPTLCEGWDARALAVHLVLRDGRPDVLAARAVAAVSPRLGRAADHAGRVEEETSAMPFPELVQRFRGGPPRWSPTAVPALEAAANTVEFFVHGQDVHRAQPGWEPEPLRPGQPEALWRTLRRLARVLYRRSPVGVVLVVPAGPRAVVVRRAESVVLTGPVEDLVLHAFGRTSAAAVQVSGPDDAVAAFSGTPLRA